MRGRGAVAAVFLSVVAGTLGGCNITEFQYFKEGIGSELYSGDSVTATANEDVYLGLVCRQAGLSTVVNADGALYCADAVNWSLVVQAGMNDIDRRCDAYLLWLDDKRRSNEPFLKELAAISASTLGILDATSAGVKAITITGIAFGLAANTFTNINSRLLALEQSTVQSVVLDTQQQFRKNNNPAAVISRPMAIYFLRNYLRICLPYSIETSVNNTVTVFHRAGPGALDPDNSLFTKTVVAKGLIESIPKGGADKPLPGVGGTPGVVVALMTGGDTPVEKKLAAVSGQDIQRNLCAPDTGVFDADTREAIRQAKAAANRNKKDTFDNTDGKLKTKKEVEYFAAAKGCKLDRQGIDRGYAVTYEKYRFPSAGEISGLQRSLMQCDASVKATGVFDTATRNGIVTAKTKAKAGGISVSDADLNTKTLNERTHDSIVLACI